MAETYIDKKGYRRFSDSGQLVSRWVKEKQFGHKLSEEQVVHHKNRDKSDNKPSNLWVFNSSKEHTKTHNKDKKKTGYW
ncbi:MAG: HNH endonuclease [Candidatus Nanoarchaeia archaeon]|jgi:hypothetical protein